MKVVDPGHVYQLSAGNGLVFVQKERGNVVRDGTTNEEVLEVLIDRVTEAYQLLPCQESIRALYLLRQALAAFQMRTARRIDALVEGTHRPHEPTFDRTGATVGATLAGVSDGIDRAPN